MDEEAAAVAGVDGDFDGAESGHRQPDGDRGQAIREHDDDSIAGLDSESSQSTGPQLGVPLEVEVRPRVAVDLSCIDALRRLMGTPGQQVGEDVGRFQHHVVGMRIRALPATAVEPSA